VGAAVLQILVFLPVLGALIVALWPVSSPLARWHLALAATGANLLVALWVGWQFDPEGAIWQLQVSRPWNARLGSSFALGIDGLSLSMILLTALLTLVAVVASRQTSGPRLCFSLLLLLESAMFGVFSARDWSLFYVFWEATLIPLFFLIDRLGGARRQRAALNFFLYTLGGSVFMLVALLFLYDAAPGHSFAMHDMASGGQGLPLTTQVLILAGLFIGFGVKMPVVPLHGWLPLAHVEAPAGVSILLSGVLLKMGAYGLLRAAETLPGAFIAMQDALFVLALLGMIYGAVLAWRQQDLKAMVAYSSVSHMGLVLLGIASSQPAGWSGAMLQMVAHGLVAGLLFLVVGSLYQRFATRDLAAYGGLAAQPRLAFFAGFAFLAALGLPGSAGFIAELQVLVAGFTRWGGLVAFAGLSLLIGAAFALRVLARVLWSSPGRRVDDLRRSEVWAAASLAGGIVLLGVWPAPLMALLSGSVARLVEVFGA
jgi:NADH-quinone oxidoreductase subunit M